MTERYVTVSVDDGHPTDFRTAELLHRYGLKATFYIPAENPERKVIDASHIRELATHFEIGGHTFHHVSLKAIADERVRAEVYEGKAWLEDVLGKKTVSFCYPRGKFNSRVAAHVRAA